MPANKKYATRARRAPPIDTASWLWALGREDEARAINPYVKFSADTSEPAIWAAHREALIAEWQRMHPDGPKKPPIQRRLEKAAAERKAQQRWAERHPGS